MLTYMTNTRVKLSRDRDQSRRDYEFLARKQLETGSDLHILAVDSSMPIGKCQPASH